MHNEAQDSVFTPDVHVVLDTLDQYLSSGKSFNRWIEVGALKLYVRRQKVIPHRNLGIKDALCLAYIIIDEEVRGQGFFKEVLQGVEKSVGKYMPDCVVYIENVDNPRLAKHLEARGYQKKVIGEDSSSYYMVVPK